MSHATLQRILQEHAIESRDWPAMRALVFHGTRPDSKLQHRLHNASNYMIALNSILVELSKQVKHKFPPNWKLSSRKAS
jgi:hypothetical protein